MWEELHNQSFPSVLDCSDLFFFWLLRFLDLQGTPERVQDTITTCPQHCPKHWEIPWFGPLPPGTEGVLYPVYDTNTTIRMPFLEGSRCHWRRRGCCQTPLLNFDSALQPDSECLKLGMLDPPRICAQSPGFEVNGPHDAYFMHAGGGAPFYLFLLPADPCNIHTILELSRTPNPWYFLKSIAGTNGRRTAV